MHGNSFLICLARPARDLQSDYHEREGRISAKSISEPRRKDSELQEQVTAAIIVILESGMTAMHVPEQASTAAEVMSARGIAVEKLAILSLDRLLILQVLMLLLKRPLLVSLSEGNSLNLKQIHIFCGDRR